MKKKILLIEDNIEMQENIAEMLYLEDYEVIIADNGKSGVSLAEENKPDLILCDIMMPALDGYGVIYALSKEPELASIPFIFLTARTEKTDFRKGMELGADDFITKPFDVVDLLNAIKTRLKKHELFKTEFSKDAKGIDSFIQDVRDFEQLKALSDDQQMRVFQKKELVFKEGKNPFYLYYIEQGIVKTYRINDDGKKYITGIHKKGDALGYLALFKNSAYQESAIALEETCLYMIPKDDFYKLLNNNHSISRKFISLLSSNIDGKEEQLMKLAYNSVRKRVADALILLNQRYNEKNGHEQQIMDISREDIAHIVGTATESVIRTLSEFKKEKIIDITPNGIEIINEALLADMRN